MSNVGFCADIAVTEVDGGRIDELGWCFDEIIDEEDCSFDESRLSLLEGAKMLEYDNFCAGVTAELAAYR